MGIQQTFYEIHNIILLWGAISWKRTDCCGLGISSYGAPAVILIVRRFVNTNLCFMQLGFNWVTDKKVRFNTDLFSHAQHYLYKSKWLGLKRSIK
jgi:hypothetical protein